MKLSEAHLERLCTDYLALDGWRTLKTNPCSDRSRGKGFGELGMADYLYIRYLQDGQVYRPLTEVMWIEWKRKGGKAQLNQKAWHLHERKLGALTLIAGEDFPADFDSFVAWYASSGLRRRV